MSRLLERSARFASPNRQLLNMILFILAVGAVAYYLSPLSPEPSDVLVHAFNANPALNGLILAVLAVGVFYNFEQAGVVAPSIQWIESFRESVDPRRARLPRPPNLIYAVARLLLDADERGGRLAPESTRAILDSVGTRMDESREMGKYIANLLVFLGLLGTFWGLLQTINAVAATITGLGTGGDAEEAVRQLIRNLSAPLEGMGTAFSSSLFGLSGGLIVGFLELQASQAQGRFYTDLEDWLAGMTETRVSRAGAQASLSEGEAGDLAEAIARLEAALAAQSDAQIKAEAANTAELKDEIRALNRSFVRGRGE